MSLRHRIIWLFRRRKHEIHSHLIILQSLPFGAQTSPNMTHHQLWQRHNYATFLLKKIPWPHPPRNMILEMCLRVAVIPIVASLNINPPTHFIWNMVGRACVRTSSDNNNKITCKIASISEIRVWRKLSNEYYGNKMSFREDIVLVSVLLKTTTLSFHFLAPLTGWYGGRASWLLLPTRVLVVCWMGHYEMEGCLFANLVKIGRTRTCRSCQVSSAPAMQRMRKVEMIFAGGKWIVR